MSKRKKKKPTPEEDEEYWIRKLGELEMEPDWYDEILAERQKDEASSSKDADERPKDD